MTTKEKHQPESESGPSRRAFLGGLAAVALTSAVTPKTMRSAGTYGIAYTSFPIRMRQTVQDMARTGPAIPAEKFIDLCHAFGGQGCQMDFAQLASHEADYLKSLRAALDEKRMFMEFSVSARLLAEPDGFARVAAVAQQLGVTRLRTALLSGRRYEDFPDMAKWQEFVSKARTTLERIEPLLKQHRLLLGVENHKDWLADEQVALLRHISSPYLGACVDFGNNVALLEDSLEVAQKLGPYAVTTHLKDMALQPYEQGFLLSEVPLGEGVLPLAKIVTVLRRHRSDINFCLEMITRDPLKVPYLTDPYWVTYEQRAPARVKRFNEKLLRKASTKPLPRITGLSSAAALAAEDENVRRCSTYARQTLGL